MLRMATISKIRHEQFVNGKSIHQISQEQKISWATAKKYAEETLDGIQSMGRRPGRLSLKGNQGVRDEIRRLLQLELDKNVHKKQRYTSIYLYKNFQERGLFKGDPRYFRKLVKKEREFFKQLKHGKSYLELSFYLGQYLQIDHGEVDVIYQQDRIKIYLFVAAVPHTSIRYCQIYLRKDSASWGDFHDKVFHFFGGVFKSCVYDNDTVLKVSSTLQQTAFAKELETYYGFQSVYCNPASGWEKGAVENAVGTCRRNYFAGVPEITDLDQTNQDLVEKCKKNIAENVHYQNKRPLQDILNEIVPQLMPLPKEWEWGKWEELKVNSYQYIQYDNHSYSVPERYVGSKVKVFISTKNIKIYCEGKCVFIHNRSFVKGEKTLEIDHYLDQIERKPRAFDFARVFQKKEWDAPLKEIRDRLKNKEGSEKADNEFVKILKLKRECSSNEFDMAIKLGPVYGGINASSIKMFIEQLQLTEDWPRDLLKNLPPNCSVDLKDSYCLDQYEDLCKKDAI